AAALAVAARNVARHGLEGRVRLHEADLFPATADRFGVIMSNPPYVPDDDVAALPPEYAHEPRLALAGGPHGLEPTERLLRAAGERLTPDGVLIVEVGAEAETLSRQHPRLPVVWLDFERGGEGVFVVTARQLEEYFGGGGGSSRRRQPGGGNHNGKTVIGRRYGRRHIRAAFHGHHFRREPLHRSRLRGRRLPAGPRAVRGGHPE